MVKVALSIYGSNGLWHILKAVLYGAVLSLIGACSSDLKSSVGQSDAASSTDLYAQYMSQAREIALAQHASSPVADAGFIQAASPFEFWLYLAIVSDEAGNTYALQQRFARLRVKEDAETKNSEWEFSQIVGVEFSLQRLANNTKQTAQSIQRVALDLAGVDTASGSVWTGPYHSQALGNDGDACVQKVSLRSPMLDASFHQSQCAAMTKTKELVLTRSNAMPVDGVVRVDDQALAVTGYGWLMHAWGIPPDVQAAAVVIDRAWLLLAEQNELQIQRSRRRSGAGAKITTATLTRLSDALTSKTEVQEFAAQWNDVGASDETVVPNSWRFSSDTNDFDISFLPLTVQNETQADAFFHVVAIKGTHAGYGFVSYGVQ